MMSLASPEPAPVRRVVASSQRDPFGADLTDVETGGSIFRVWSDRRRRGAMALAILALVGVMRFRANVQPGAVLLLEFCGVLSLILLGGWLDRRGWPARRPSWVPPGHPLGRFVVATAILVPLLGRPLLGVFGQQASPWEMVMLTCLGIGGLVLSLCGTAPRQAGLAVICGGFLMLFTTAISDRVDILSIAVVWVLGCLWWMLANHWERLEVHLAQTVRRPRGTRMAMVLLGLAVIAPVGWATWGRVPASRVLSWGIMPTSGGNQWTDPSARSGVGSGDAVVAAKRHATSFGAVESEIFLQSHQPSLFDVFDDMLGKPKRSRKADKAIALMNRAPGRNRTRTAESQQGDAAFSLRREAKPQPTKLADRKSDAVLQWIGPRGERLAIRRWDRFDGQEWSAQDETRPRDPAPPLPRRDIDGKAWFFRHERNSPLAGPTRADAVKLIGLQTQRIPAPVGTLGVHIADVDREDFFELTEDGSFAMPGRDAIPPLTMIRLVTRELDGDRLAGLKSLPATRSERSSEGSVETATEGTEMARRLAIAWTDGVTAPWERVETIVGRLRTEFHFDRDTASDGEDPLRDFLVSRRGGDHLFASAAAVMIRSLGYECRFVAGFYVPSPKRGWAVGQADVLPEDAHVWAEVLVEEGVWAAIEPTPGYDPPIRFRTLGRRVAAVILVAAPWLGLLGLVGVFLWWCRRIWGEWFCRAIWQASFPLAARQRVAILVRLLELRGRLAGVRRPVGMTPRVWVRQVAASLDASLQQAADRFFDSADATFFGPGNPSTDDWLVDADQVARGVNIRVLVRSRRSSSA